MSTNIQSNKAPTGFLATIERVGNKIPDVTILFVYALIICFVASGLLSMVDFNYISPVNNQKLQIVNMLQSTKLVEFLTSMVKNFMNFPPLGITIVATLGIGIADSSGYLHVLIKKLLSITPKKLVTPSVIFVSIVCHIASDSAYVILMPISAMIFYATGKHPLAGIAAGRFRQAANRRRQLITSMCCVTIFSVWVEHFLCWRPVGLSLIKLWSPV